METKEAASLQEKICELEKKIMQLRTGRRILMSLLEKITREKSQQIVGLEKEIQRLKTKNRRYANELLYLKIHSETETTLSEEYLPPYS